MIGRGAMQNPWVFKEVAGSDVYKGEIHKGLTLIEDAQTPRVLLDYMDLLLEDLSEKAAIGKMSRFEHRSIKEIALQLNISEKAVEYHITSSLKTLRINLKDFMLGSLFVAAISQL